MIKTDNQVDPVEELPCPDCDGVAEWTGTGVQDYANEVWQDRYKCPVCGKRFVAGPLLWCNQETGEFYVYEVEVTADASK